MTTIRTKNGVLEPVVDRFWGMTLKAGPNPDITPIPERMEECVVLPTDYVPLPLPHVARIASLYKHVLDWDSSGAKTVDSTCEVGVVLFRGDGERHPVSAWRVAAPTQAVGGGHVEADYTKPMVCLETGERFEDGTMGLIAQGYVVAGTSHSHGRLGTYFSGTDDKSELKQPGLHFVLGDIKGTDVRTARCIASLVRHGKRYGFTMTPEGPQAACLSLLAWNAEALDLAEAGTIRFHDDVLSVVTRGRLQGHRLDSTPLLTKPTGTGSVRLWPKDRDRWWLRNDDAEDVEDADLADLWAKNRRSGGTKRQRKLRALRDSMMTPKGKTDEAMADVALQVIASQCDIAAVRRALEEIVEDAFYGNVGTSQAVCRILAAFDYHQGDLLKVPGSAWEALLDM